MKKKTTSRLPLPLWAQILLPLLVAVLCAGILLLGSIRPYEMAKTYLKVAFMDGSGVVSDNGTNGLNIVQTDIDTDYTGETAEEGTPVVSDYGSQCAVLEAKSIGLYAPVYWGRRCGTAGRGRLPDTGICTAGRIGKLCHQRPCQHLFP